MVFCGWSVDVFCLRFVLKTKLETGKHETGRESLKVALARHYQATFREMFLFFPSGFRLNHFQVCGRGRRLLHLGPEIGVAPWPSQFLIQWSGAASRE